MSWIQGRDRAKHLDGLIADGVTMQAGRKLHRQKGHDLKHVVFDHVPDRSCGVVELPSPLNAEFLRHGDLYTLKVVPVPDRLQKAVSEAKEQKIEDCFFAEVVIDAKDPRLWKHRMQGCIQLLCRGKIVSKWLLNNYPCILHAA